MWDRLRFHRDRAWVRPDPSVAPAHFLWLGRSRLRSAAPQHWIWLGTGALGGLRIHQGRWSAGWDVPIRPDRGCSDWIPRHLDPTNRCWQWWGAHLPHSRGWGLVCRRRLQCWIECAARWFPHSFHPRGGCWSPGDPQRTHLRCALRLANANLSGCSTEPVSHRFQLQLRRWLQLQRRRHSPRWVPRGDQRFWEWVDHLIVRLLPAANPWGRCPRRLPAQLVLQPGWGGPGGRCDQRPVRSPGWRFGLDPLCLFRGWCVLRPTAGWLAPRPFAVRPHLSTATRQHRLRRSQRHGDHRSGSQSYPDSSLSRFDSPDWSRWAGWIQDAVVQRYRYPSARWLPTVAGSVGPAWGFRPQSRPVVCQPRLGWVVHRRRHAHWFLLVLLWTRDHRCLVPSPQRATRSFPLCRSSCPEEQIANLPARHLRSGRRCFDLAPPHWSIHRGASESGHPFADHEVRSGGFLIRRHPCFPPVPAGWRVLRGCPHGWWLNWSEAPADRRRLQHPARAWWVGSSSTCHRPGADWSAAEHLRFRSSQDWSGSLARRCRQLPSDHSRWTASLHGNPAHRQTEPGHPGVQTGAQGSVHPAPFPRFRCCWWASGWRDRRFPSGGEARLARSPPGAMDLDPCLLAQPSVRRRKGPGHWMVYPDSHRSGAEARHCQLPLLPPRSGFELNPDR